MCSVYGDGLHTLCTTTDNSIHVCLSPYTPLKNIIATLLGIKALMKAAPRAFISVDTMKTFYSPLHSINRITTSSPSLVCLHVAECSPPSELSLGQDTSPWIDMLSNQSLGPVAEGLSREDPDAACNHTAAWDWVHTVQPGYMSIICALGMAGNAFVLLVFCHRRPRHRTAADIYLGNLAAADLLMVSCLPFWVATIIGRFQWRFGETMCQLVNVVISMNYYCSVLFLTLVSADRYLAVTRPLSSHRGAGPGRGRQVPWAHALCLGVWALGALLSLPALLFRTVRSFPELGVDACVMQYPHGGWRMRYNLTFNLVGFLIPVPVVSFCTYHICRVLRESRALRGRSCREQTTAAVAVERKAAYLVMVVLAIFVLCWLPYQIIVLLDSLDYYQVISGCTWAHVLDIGVQLATYLGYSNSALNPFLYVIVGKHFKQRAREVFRQTLCRRRWRKTAGNSNSSTLRYTDSTKV